MRVLVTGGSGLLGAFVVAALRDTHDVGVLDRVEPAQEVRYHGADILDLAALQRHLRGYHAVIHLAAIDAGNPHPDEVYFRTNVLGTWNVLQAAQAAGIGQVVVASSSSVYGVDAHSPPDYLPVDEDHPLRPAGVYSLSKVLMETTAASFARRGSMGVICLRPAHIVRPKTEAPILAQIAVDDGNPDAAKALARKLAVQPYGSLPALRGYVRSRDAAQAFVLALGYDDEPFEVFNVAADDSMGHTPTPARMAALYGSAPAIRDLERFKTTPNASAFDSRRAHGRLGWTAAGGWQDLEAEHP